MPRWKSVGGGEPDHFKEVQLEAEDHTINDDSYEGNTDDASGHPHERAAVMFVAEERKSRRTSPNTARPTTTSGSPRKASAAAGASGAGAAR